MIIDNGCPVEHFGSTGSQSMRKKGESVMQMSDGRKDSERKRLACALERRGRSPYCGPHRGENERDGHWRWQGGERRRVKGKDQK